MLLNAVAIVLSIVSTIGGIFVVVPRIHDRFWILQVAMKEGSWIPGFIGLIAILLAPTQILSLILGFIGIALSAVPFLQISDTISNLEQSMRDGLGADYETAIPPQVKAKLNEKRWSPRMAFDLRAVPYPTKLTHDVVYQETPQRALKMDIYQPTFPPLIGDAYPAIITIHGGSWQSGDKGSWFIENHRYLASQGYVVFDIQYRFSQEALWPTQLDDVRAAIRWVKAHASIYQLDPTRVALLGRSAGGHLALQAAYRAQAENADTQVAAVIAIYAPSDFRMWRSVLGDVVPKLLGGIHRAIPERYADASVTTHVRNDLPPTLLIHGLQDPLVPKAHAELLANLLQTTNTPCVVLRIPWGEHGFDGSMHGLGSQLIRPDVDRFLAWALYRNVL